MKPCAAMLYRLRTGAALLLFFFMAVAFVLPGSAEAQGAGKEVRIGWYETPFNIMDKSGRRSGYAYESRRRGTGRS